MAGLHMKECFVALERLDEKSLRKCLQKHGLKLASPSSVKRLMTNRQNNCQTRSIYKKAKQKKRKKRNTDNFILEKNRKRKKRKIYPLCYTDDESCDETKVEVESQVLFGSADNRDSSKKFDKMPVQSEPEGVRCDEISTTAETTTVCVSEVREELAEDGRMSQSQIKNEVRPQHEDVCCGKTDNREISSAVENDIEIIKVCEKQSATLLSSKKTELTVDTESSRLRELEDDGYDSREDGEDERRTVIFEEEFQKDMDLEDLTEFEKKEMSKKFKNREITNRKKQRLVKFKRKSMAERNLAKIERKPKSKIVEGPGSRQETTDKSSECVSEECLKEVCGLVKRLHELSRIIALLQRELPNNEEMSVHFNRVINAQQENFHREIRKGQKTIIRCYEKMLSFYSDTSQVALEIGKRTSLSVEDVVNIISLCILIEGCCETDKSGASPESLKKIITDNFLKVIKKKISQMEGTGKQPRLQNKFSGSFAFPSPQSNHKYQTNNYSTQQAKHQKNSNLLPLQTQQAVDNFTSSHPQPRNVAKHKFSSGNFFPSSRTNLKQLNVTRSPGSPFSRSNSQDIVNKFIGFPASQRDISQKHKEVSSTPFSVSQTDVHQTLDSSIGFPPVTNTQSNFTLPSPQSNTHHSVISTDLPQSESNSLKTYNRSQRNDKNTSSEPSKQKKERNELKNLSGLPKRQIVKNPTGSRPNNTSGDVNRHPALLTRPYDPFKPHVWEKAVRSSEIRFIPERQRPPNRTPQKCALTPGPGQHGVYQTYYLDRPVLQRPLGNQTAALGDVVHPKASIRSGRTSQALSHHVNHTVGVFPQRNTLPVSSADMASPAAVLLLKLPENKPVESNKYLTRRPIGCSKSSEFLPVTTSRGLVNSAKQTTRPSADNCPLSTPNFMVPIRMSDNTKHFKTHVDLGPRNCSSTIAVRNSQNSKSLEQGVLDPTAPQKLTMNSRLQAGPVSNSKTDGTEIGEKSIHPSTEAKKVCNELGNSNGEKSESRVYICARDDCRNPGVRICKSCHSIIYCSATCQFKHWVQKHKAECYQLRALRE